jgi:hypothetical protein
MMINDARRAYEIKSWTAVAKKIFNKKRTFHQQIGLKFKDDPSTVLHLEYGLYGVETWTPGKVDRKYLEGLKYDGGEGWRISFGPIE